MSGDRFDYELEYERPVRADEPDPETFFAERGFALVAHEAEGVSWVDLISLTRPDLRVVRYGRGSDSVAAASAATRRWIVEQAG